VESSFCTVTSGGLAGAASSGNGDSIRRLELGGWCVMTSIDRSGGVSVGSGSGSCILLSYFLCEAREGRCREEAFSFISSVLPEQSAYA
jgi:hypothetical protein